MEVKPIDLRELDRQASNVYEGVIVAAKRARQINDENKVEYNALLSTIPVTGTDDDSEDIENPAQSKISLDFEMKQKPHIQALHELLDAKIDYEYKEK